MEAKDMQALLSLDKSGENVEFMLGQFAGRYIESVGKGRGDAWMRAIRSYLDLIESSAPEFQKRNQPKQQLELKS